MAPLPEASWLPMTTLDDQPRVVEQHSDEGKTARRRSVQTASPHSRLEAAPAPKASARSPPIPEVRLTSAFDPLRTLRAQRDLGGASSANGSNKTFWVAQL